MSGSHAALTPPRHRLSSVYLSLCTGRPAYRTVVCCMCKRHILRLFHYVGTTAYVQSQKSRLIIGLLSVGYSTHVHLLTLTYNWNTTRCLGKKMYRIYIYVISLAEMQLFLNTFRTYNWQPFSNWLHVKLSALFLPPAMRSGNTFGRIYLFVCRSVML